MRMHFHVKDQNWIFNAKVTVRMDISTVMNTLFLCLVNFSFIIVGVFLNSVVIISLWRSSQLRKKLCYFVIFVLSCFDLAVAAINHPILIISTIFWSIRSSNPQLITGPLITIQLGGLSMFTLLILNVERFLALSYPFFHQRAVTKARIKVCLVIWMIIQIGLSALFFLLGIKIAHALISKFVLLFLCVFIYSNYKMFVIAKSKREDERIAPADGATISNQEAKKHKLNVKKISTCSLSVCCFFICSLPQIIFSTWRSTLHKNEWNDRDIRLFGIWCNTFVFMNSTFNCLIFFWRNSILRREGMKTAKFF